MTRSAGCCSTCRIGDLARGGGGAQERVDPTPLAEPQVQLGAAAGQRPAVAGHGRLDPLPDQVLSHRQPGAPRQRHPHPGDPARRLAPGSAGQQQARATGAQQQVGQAVEAARRRGIGQVQDEQVDEAGAGQPAGQLHRLGGVGGRTTSSHSSETPSRAAVAGSKRDPGSSQATSPPAAWQAASDPSARLVAPPPAGASSRARAPRGQPPLRSAASSPGCPVGRGSAATIGPWIRAPPQTMGAQRFEEFGEGSDGPGGIGHGPTDDRTDVLVWEAPKAR